MTLSAIVWFVLGFINVLLIAYTLGVYVYCKRCGAGWLNAALWPLMLGMVTMAMILDYSGVDFP